MSFATDLKFGKWIVRRGDAPQDVVQQCLSKIKKAESVGEPCSNLLTLLYKQGVIDRTQADRIKVAWKEHREAAKREVSVPVSVDEESVETVAQELTHADENIEEVGDVAQEAGVVESDTVEAESTKSVTPSSEKVTCIECQSLNEPEEKDCQTCGAVLPAQNLVACSTCHHTQKKSRKNCYHCGCDLSSGEAGKTSACCRNCRTVLMPDQVICLQCGSLYEGQKHKIWAWTGYGIAGLQALLVLGSASWLSMGETSLDTIKGAAKQVVLVDPYDDVPPRFVSENFVGGDLSVEDRTWLEDASRKKDSWRALETAVVEKEDRYGLHGALMLGLSFYEENRGLELVALAKAHDSNSSLKALALAWRMKQARKAFDRYEIKQALAQSQNLVNGDQGSGFNYFWTGVFAFADQDLEKAKIWFEKSLSSKRPVLQSHLFLYLLSRKDKAVAEKHLELLYEGVQDANAIKAVLEPYLEKS